MTGQEVRLRRKAADPRVASAKAAHAAGDFAAARQLAADLVADGQASFEVLRGLAELEYLLGDYAAAEALLWRVVEDFGGKAARRLDAEVGLALVYLQTNRYAEASGLFAGMERKVDVPIWKLMTSFGDERPYRADWGEPAVEVPFIQSTTWELPCIRIEVNGLEVDARIDTGGELLTLSPDVAEAIGLEAVASAQGSFAAGATSEVRYGRIDTVRVGPLTVEAVPAAVVSLDRPVVGTGFLRQFLATLDYPGGRLVLRPRPGSAGGTSALGVEVPFALAVTHLILARGSFEGRGPVTFLLDSGLEDEGGASFAAPRATLDAAGIPLPELTEEIGESGAGHLSQRFGRFPLHRLGLGALVQQDTSGLYGVFPETWREVAGISIHGILSHGFLRRYAWTLDFDRMAMTFASAAAD